MVAEKVHPVLLTAAQGGRALVAAGEGGEYRNLQTQCRADERFPQRLIPSIIGGNGRWGRVGPQRSRRESLGSNVNRSESLKY